MPTYEYECTSCKHVFEKFQSITTDPIKRCPVCGKKVRRLISAGAGLIFKGSGFYITDYRKKDYQEREKKDREEKTNSKPSEQPSKTNDQNNTATTSKQEKKESPKAKK